MYESFFGLNRRPFPTAPDANCCAGVGTIQQVYDELYDCLEHGKGIGVLTAPAGTGKTLLCRKLLEDMNEQFRGVFLPCANFSDCKSLLQTIVFELQHPYNGLDEQELRLELLIAARDEQQAGKTILLVVDEAHLLNESLLEEIRSITNIIENGDYLVRVLLCGQLSLEETMTSPALDALNQRIGCHQTLEPLTRRNSIDYIEFRIKWAGAQLSEVFSEDSLKLIVEVSDGNPRCLNQLCDHALVLGFVEEEKPVGAATVQEALNDLKRLPLQWNDALSATASFEESSDHSFVEEENTAAPVMVETGAIENQAENISFFEIGGSNKSPNDISETDISEQQLEPGVADSGIAGGQAENCVTETDHIQSEQTDDVVFGLEQDDSSDPFDEELVEDHYASIDSQRERISLKNNLDFGPEKSKRFHSTSPVHEQVEVEVVSIPLSDVSHQEPLDSVWFTSDAEALSSPDPVRIIDNIAPLLDAEAEIPPYDNILETRQQNDRTNDTISIGTAEASRLNSEKHDISKPTLKTIGSTVFDTRLETEPGTEPVPYSSEESSTVLGPELRSKPLFSDGKRLKLPVQFDVVQPDGQEIDEINDMVVQEPLPHGEQTLEMTGERTSTTGRQRNFDQLFSRLRRSRLA